MRLFIICFAIVVLAGCGKDKFTTAPQIKFQSLNPNAWRAGNTSVDKDIAPKIKIRLTDAEGDVGFKPDSDTSWIFIRRTNNTTWDSLRLPAISFTGKSFQADVEINIFEMMRYGNCPAGGSDLDTMYFELYLQDFAKNKSNTITTEDPVYYICR